MEFLQSWYGSTNSAHGPDERSRLDAQGIKCLRLYSQICLVWLVLLRIHRNALIVDRNRERERVKQLNNKRGSEYFGVNKFSLASRLYHRYCVSTLPMISTKDRPSMLSVV